MSNPERPDKLETESRPEYKPMSEQELAAATALNKAQWEASKAAQAAAAAADAPQIARLQEHLGIKNPDELREDVIAKALQEGGVRLHQSLPKSLSPEGSTGFQDLSSRVEGGVTETRLLAESQLRDPQEHSSADMERTINARGIAEMISIHRNVRRIYTDVIVPGKKGLLGFGRTPDRTERQATSDFEQPTHRELITNGKDEPAVTFLYFAGSTYVSGDDNAVAWKDNSNRRGQRMWCEIVLPESIAKEVEKQIESDPKFMRTLVERFAKEKLLKDPNEWGAKQGNVELGDERDSLRPPYERWDTVTGGKIYVQKEGGPQGWHEENIRLVKQS